MFFYVFPPNRTLDIPHENGCIHLLEDGGNLYISLKKYLNCPVLCIFDKLTKFLQQISLVKCECNLFSFQTKCIVGF